MNDTSKIWLEVTNVRSAKEPEQTLEIQVKGDRADREPEWWTVNASAYIDDGIAKTYRALSENLDKKRIVIAALGPVADKLECTHFRIQYADSNSR